MPRVAGIRAAGRPFEAVTELNHETGLQAHPAQTFWRGPGRKPGFWCRYRAIHEIAAELADVQNLGIQIAVVVGGGNFFRGVAEQAKDMDRVSADHMGMLATVINALALQDALEKQGVLHPRAVRDRDEPGCRAVHPPPRHAPPGKRPRGDLRRRHRESLFLDRYRRLAAGHGDQGRRHPESHQGGWRLRRRSHAGEKREEITQITYLDVLKKGLKVMDATAIRSVQDNNLPIIIFNLNQHGNIKKSGDRREGGSLVSA